MWKRSLESGFVCILGRLPFFTEILKYSLSLSFYSLPSRRRFFISTPLVPDSKRYCPLWHCVACIFYRETQAEQKSISALTVSGRTTNCLCCLNGRVSSNSFKLKHYQWRSWGRDLMQNGCLEPRSGLLAPRTHCLLVFSKEVCLIDHEGHLRCFPSYICHCPDFFVVLHKLLVSFLLSPVYPSPPPSRPCFLCKPTLNKDRWWVLAERTQRKDRV